jgi:hypothetical protein
MINLRCKHLGSPMSALGQKQTSRPELAMSALPPKADITERVRNVRFVPEADIGHYYSITSSTAVSTANPEFSQPMLSRLWRVK